MKLFLIIVGALVTAFAICVLMLVLWLRWLTRKLGKSLGGLAGLAEKLGGPVPPLRIELRRIETVRWQRADEAAALVEPLRRAHFQEIGGFAMEPGEVVMQAFQLPAENVHAIVYEHPQAGVWLDLVTRYQDGSKLTYANLADTLLDRAENNVIRYHEKAPAEELLKLFLAERPAKPMESVPPEGFAGYFERAYAESMDWMIARGGPTEAEIRRHCEKRGQEFTPILVTAVRARWAAAIDEFYEEQLQERFLAESHVNAARWEQIRDRVVFVHDRMAPARLENLCEQEYDEDEDDEGLYDTRPASSALAGGATSPREVFARWNAALNNGRRYEKIGEVSEPVAADVYLSPEEDEEEE
ncbi:MAG TPA: hypothetical protein VMV10_16010 [Pirellulales bacterium]|nr:hypothetical protein [Pirellulales bacterium]